MGRYTNLMLNGPHNATGVDIVIGANDGISFDPSSKLGYWDLVPHHTKVFIEPAPPLFNRLMANTKELSNRVLVNKAVRLENQPANLTLFCWDIHMVDEAWYQQKQILPPQARQPNPSWSALCTGGKERLM